MFSVVIPVFNHCRFLRRAVESALASTLVQEVLLCDDGSSDDSPSLCKLLAQEFPDRVNNLSEDPSHNKGAHARLNQLCRLAKQTWIRVLNSDDYFLPLSFETLRSIADQERADFVSGSMLLCDAGGRIHGTKRGVFDPEYPLPNAPAAQPLLRNQEVRNILLHQNFIATTTNMAFKRELFEKIGGFSDFRYAHDLDFALRATMLGNSVWTAAFLATYRIHESNTIGEMSAHMDGEITRLYANFLDDFPEVERDALSHEFLHSNRHIAPFPSSVKKKIPPPNSRLESGLFLSPGLPASCLPNVLLALGTMNYDFIAVSRSLANPPSAMIQTLQHSLGAIGRAASLAKTSAPASARFCGRLLRCPPREGESQVSSLSVTFGSGALIEGQNIYLGARRKATSNLRPDVLEELRKNVGGDPSSNRPVIFVLPAFLAVGGVERNTIEVIRNLKDSYRFIVITTEYLSERQGSLHWQLDEIAVPVFDLAEIAAKEHHLMLLSILADLLTPGLVWICNGSPWLLENTVYIRRLFANIPIVDQEAYDTQEGWIAHYDDKGIQSFDHFIAINGKIRSKFIQHFRIPSHRVSLIYHAVSEKAVRAARSRRGSTTLLRNALGIPKSFSNVFIFVGRLTAQKQPLSFLEIVRAAQETNPDAYFLMVGNGDMSAECDRFIAENKLGNVRRIPYHPHIPELMAVADGMIVTSAYEGLPIAMLEALAVGIPVLATDVGDIRVVLEKYGSGLVAPSKGAAGKSAIPGELWHAFINTLPALTAAATSHADQILSRFGCSNVSAQYDRVFRDAFMTALCAARRKSQSEEIHSAQICAIN